MTRKLSEFQVKLILDLHFKDGVNGKELAHLFDISDSMIYFIVSGQAWSHLYEPFKGMSRPSPLKDTLNERFLSRINKDGPISPHLGTRCWLWTSYTDKDGYGLIRHKGKNLKAHRVSMEILAGNSSELCVLHRCDNPPCVNPDHLFSGTITDNNDDRTHKGRGKVIRGGKSNLAKLSEDQVITIRQRYASEAITQEQLAKEYNVGGGTVSRIVSGKTWKHLLKDVTALQTRREHAQRCPADSVPFDGMVPEADSDADDYGLDGVTL